MSPKTIALGTQVPEKDLQRLVEQNLFKLLKCYLIGSEVSVGNGRIDTLGIDEKGQVVIIEYKKSRSRSIINQSLYYGQIIQYNSQQILHMIREVSDIPQHIKDCPKLDPRHVIIAHAYSTYDLAIFSTMGRDISLFTYLACQDIVLLNSLTECIAADQGNSHPIARRSPYILQFLIDLANTKCSFENDRHIQVYTPCSADAGRFGKGKCALVYGQELVLLDIKSLSVTLNKIYRGKYSYDELLTALQSEFNCTSKDGNGLVLAPSGYQVGRADTRKKYTALSKKVLLELVPEFGKFCQE